MSFAGKFFLPTGATPRLPLPSPEAPFANLLIPLFFEPRQGNEDFHIHGPNVVRLTELLFQELFTPLDALKSGLYAAAHAHGTAVVYAAAAQRIKDQLDIADQAKEKEFLAIAALYHDIGKIIRKPNHPQIGANLLLSYDPDSTGRLMDALRHSTDSTETEYVSKHHRFTRLASGTQHHDKFGVVSTGEASLPLFSDIPYFTSSESEAAGIKKNITSVMLMNLADIAAVATQVPKSTHDKACGLARSAREHMNDGNRAELENAFRRWAELCNDPAHCMGLDRRKVEDVLEDWGVLIDAIDDHSVKGDRSRLKARLLELERNPRRTITRIRRLLVASAVSAHADSLATFFTPTTVESVLVGTLGSHQLVAFCEQLATVVKLDYALGLFQALTCAVVRTKCLGGKSVEVAEDHARALDEDERTAFATLMTSDPKCVQDAAMTLTVLFVKILSGLVGRYAGVLGHPSVNPRRFGFQLRDLMDRSIRHTILDLLCRKENRDHVALTWMADEVYIWSMD